MRPTIPLANWMLAVELDLTAAVQCSPDTPAFQCTCEQCTMWHQHWRDLLPLQTSEQLQRLKVEVDRPSDLYAYGQTDDGTDVRAIFHAVGKILSGPVSSTYDPVNGPHLDYVMLRPKPAWLGLRVASGKDAVSARPRIDLKDGNRLIEIDFRLHVPASILNSEQRRGRARAT